MSTCQDSDSVGQGYVESEEGEQAGGEGESAVSGDLQLPEEHQHLESHEHSSPSLSDLVVPPR